MLMATVKFTGAADYESQTEINTSTANTVISLSKELKMYLSDPIQTHDLLDNYKDRNITSKRKWTDHE